MTERQPTSYANILARLDRRADGDAYIDRMIQGAVSASRRRQYTSLIDDAITLVPHRWAWSIDTMDRVEGNEDAWAWCTIKTPDPFDMWFERATAPTPALAICIAALRARVYKEGLARKRALAEKAKADD